MLPLLILLLLHVDVLIMSDRLLFFRLSFHQSAISSLMMDFVLCVSIDFYSIFILIASENMQKKPVCMVSFSYLSVSVYCFDMRLKLYFIAAAITNTTSKQLRFQFWPVKILTN